MKAPLPESLRPAELEGFVGQPHIRSQIQALLAGRRDLPSLLLFGPPGCGKSTLGLLLARATGKKMLRLSAPEAGIQQLRRQLAGVEVLVLDELHRFSKAQQDFFLPILESGEMTMIATTTENPSFSVTRQLLSRLHVLRLKPLSRDDLLDMGNILDHYFKILIETAGSNAVQRFITENSSSSIVEKIHSYVTMRYRFNITPGKICDELYLNNAYVSRLFKKETGSTLTEFVNRKRIEHALLLLNTTNMQIQIIAQHCGISDVNYFTKLFKKQIGKTPKEYRESLRSISHKK